MRRFFPIALLLVAPGRAEAVNVGDKAPDFTLTDAFGKVYSLASFPKPIFEVWYEGKASLEQNKWLKERIYKLRAEGRLSDTRYDSIGIANYQETAIPNALIDIAVRMRSRKHGVRVLCDRDGRMMRLWGFRNGRSNIYVFDAQRRLIWKSSGPLTQKRAKQYLRMLLRLTRKR
jgi:hypothetical protein